MGRADASDLMEKEWESAIFKHPVPGPLFTHHTGLTGDGHADTKNHGGFSKAINAYPHEHFTYWLDKLGLECLPGAFGENFTTQGITEEDIFIGDTFKVGEIIVQVSQPRQPCWKLDRKWKTKNLTSSVQQTGRTGWYFRVLQEGEVDAPDEFELIERPHPEWSIALANRIMYHEKGDWDAAHQLANCPALSESWQTLLLNRSEKR